MKRAAITLAIVLLVALIAGLVAWRQFDRWVAATDLPPLVSELSHEVRARDGSLLRAYTVGDGRWRLGVSLDAVDPGYLAMLVAYEDRRFYSHNGVDGRALLRAAWQAATRGEIVSGGSTLTMQVARLLENSGTGRWAGKLRQIRLALALERHLSKAEILTLYLNHAPFGGNLEGVRAASLAWFGQEPRRLTWAESALLVALPQSPETRRPDRFLAAAEVARDTVLIRAAVLGVLDADSAAAARTTPLPTARAPFPALAPHLADRARAMAQTGSAPQFLTIDAALQTSLESLASDAVRDLGQAVSVAIIVADHTSGEILASVGSAGYRADTRAGYVDMTRALRSPGSTLKPLVYGLAFDQGLVHPDTLMEDRPISFGRYNPQNFDGQFRGTIRVREALQMSLNIPVVELTHALGPAHVLARMRRAGARPVVPGGQPGLAISLGGVGVTLEDMVTLYAALANHGQARALRWSQSDETGNANPAQVISPEAAWHIGDILSGLAPPDGAPRNRLAYKTGTSYGHRDAWAIGYDGRYVAGVWIGRPDGTPVPGAFGGSVAAPVLFDVFQRASPRLVPLPPPPPATLISGTSGLPLPLQRFRSRTALFEPDSDAPVIAFPPDGALLETPERLALRVRGGTGPFTWLLNGTPTHIASHERESDIAPPASGYLRLTVIDARGRSAHSNVAFGP